MAYNFYFPLLLLCVSSPYFLPFSFSLTHTIQHHPSPFVTHRLVFSAFLPKLPPFSPLAYTILGTSCAFSPMFFGILPLAIYGVKEKKSGSSSVTEKRRSAKAASQAQLFFGAIERSSSTTRSQFYSSGYHKNILSTISVNSLISVFRDKTSGKYLRFPHTVKCVLTRLDLINSIRNSNSLSS